MQEPSTFTLPEKYRVDLSLALASDRFDLRKRLQKLANLRQTIRSLMHSNCDEAVASFQRYQQQLAQFKSKYSHSCLLLEQRQALPVHIEYPESLPVSQQQQAIAELIDNIR